MRQIDRLQNRYQATPQGGQPVLTRDGLLAHRAGQTPRWRSGAVRGAGPTGPRTHGRSGSRSPSAADRRRAASASGSAGGRRRCPPRGSPRSDKADTKKTNSAMIMVIVSMQTPSAGVRADQPPAGFQFSARCRRLRSCIACIAALDRREARADVLLDHGRGDLEGHHVLDDHAGRRHGADVGALVGGGLRLLGRHVRSTARARPAC